MTTGIAVHIVVLLVLVATVSVVCLSSPVKIAMQAPHGDELFLFEIRHPAVRVDLALDGATVLGWAVGERKMPRFRAEVMGIRVREVWVRWAARKGWAFALREIERRRRGPGNTGKEEEKEEEKEKEDGKARTLGIPKIALAREILRGVQTIGDVERLMLKIDFGTGDPATTGLVVAGLMFLEPFLPEEAEIAVQPYWSELVIRVEGEGRAQLFPYRAVRAVLSLALWRMRTGMAATALATAAPSNRS